MTEKSENHASSPVSDALIQSTEKRGPESYQETRGQTTATPRTSVIDIRRRLWLCLSPSSLRRRQLREAIRCLKRQLSNVVYRQLVADRNYIH
jgi:hypothetical protein